MINGKLCVYSIFCIMLSLLMKHLLLDQLHFRLESSIRLLLLKSLKLKVANLLIEQDKVDDNKVADTTNTELIDEQKSSLPKI